MTKKKVTEDDINDLMKLLTEGEAPEGVTLDDLPPTMTRKQASSILWYLQEVMDVLPSSFEMCDECEVIYDSDAQGSYIDETSFDETNYYREHGVDADDLKPLYGKRFCSPECEYAAILTGRKTKEEA